MRIVKLVDSYLQYRAQAGYSPRTLLNDRSVLGRLVTALGTTDSLSVTPVHIDQFLGSEAARGLAATTLNTEQATISGFFKWSMERGYVNPLKNPMAGRRYRPVQKKGAVRVPIQKFQFLLDSAANPRDRMVLAVGLYLLLRQGEAVNLRVGDVDLDEGVIRVLISKTSDYDEMPITAELDRELRRWYLHYQQDCGPLQKNWYLLPTMRPTGFQTFSLTPHRPISKSEDIIRRSLLAIGIEGERIGMHTLRRSAARAILTELEHRGVDHALRRVSAWLHHASTRTTEIYLGLDVDRAVRDKEFRGMSMYPSLVEEEVSGHGDESNEALRLVREA